MKKSLIIFILNYSAMGHYLQNNSSLNDLIVRAYKRNPPILIEAWQGPLNYPCVSLRPIVKNIINSPKLREIISKLQVEVDKTVLEFFPKINRVNRLSDIPKEMLDSRSNNAGANAEVFALSMSDCNQMNYFRTRGINLALLAAISNDPQYLQACIQMLTIISKFNPLQRPGWTLYDKNRIMPTEGDGVWLATAWGMSGIVDMLTILENNIPIDLKRELDKLLINEIYRVIHDFAFEIPWYVKSDTYTSNQWIEINVALVKSCMYLKSNNLLEVYNFGINNLALSLSRLGDDGAFIEGVTYAEMTAGSLLDIVTEIREMGDKRLNNYKFVDNCWLWICGMLMPGTNVVNSYDSKMSRLPEWAVRSPLSCLVSAVAATSNKNAITVVNKLFPEANASLPSLRYQVMIESNIHHDSEKFKNINPYGYFPSQQQIVWRSKLTAPSLKSQGWGLWLRGGALYEGHVHRDQGQVSIYSEDNIILMDCGTPDYSTENLVDYYESVKGHNVVQVGSPKTLNMPVMCPISVKKLSNIDGSIEIDCTNAYHKIEKWIRKVEWNNSGAIIITDSVKFMENIPAGNELLRFHTGSKSFDNIVVNQGSCIYSWSTATISLNFNSDITCNLRTMPDATQKPFAHQTIILSSIKTLNEFKVVTNINLNLNE